MKVLVACEFSGIVREAFKQQGHDAWSCDLLPTEIPGQHIQDDVLLHLNEEWDLMIAHPPCTYLSNSGVCWLYNKDKTLNTLRWKQMNEGAIFFNQLLKANIPKIAIENPIPHKYALIIIGQKYSQIIQPWMFGHKETKATCLWLKNLPSLISTSYLKEETKALPKNISQRIHYLSPSSTRGLERSRTFVGIAQAMALQWQ